MERRWWVLLGLSTALLSACGGDDDAAPAPAPNQAPVATITAPAANSRFAAGDTITFAGSATDAEDGTLAASRLTWWAELHHDAHTHPFQPETSGGTGQATIPTQGETSANIFYRFHLRATDSAGAVTEVTRDILPRTVVVTLATDPPGLALSLDGQGAPGSFTGVVGIERRLTAADQTANGRRWRFVRWSDGGAASHLIDTPATDTTYTATFEEDVAPNQPPTVSLTAPAAGSNGTVGTPIALSATADDSDGNVTGVEFFENGVKIGATDTSAPYGVSWTPATAGTRTLTARATDDQGATTTSGPVAVTIATPAGDTQAPVARIDAPANLTGNLSGTLAVTASATDNVGVTSLEIQLDGQAVTGGSAGGSPLTVNIDTTVHAAGQHVLRARARDAAGNTSAWASAVVSFGGSRTQPAGFTRSEWVGGLSSATAFAQAPDGRFFVAEQGGTLRVVDNGTLLATPFITLAVDPQGERGLLGVALHPQFASNRWIYLYHTTTENGTHNRISRFTADAGNPNVVQAGSELRIADLPALSGATNHNGGAMHFGLDGKLYVAVGDNADSSKAPDLNDPFGKMLRFNDDGTIPTDNPHYQAPATLVDAIWARGLRNPFTFSVRASDGRLHINDVGQGTWEEINVGAPGANYGWPSTEGPTSAAGIAAPLFAYDHSSSPDATGGFFSGCAITGGAFYGSSGSFPAAYRNSYYFADYCGGFIGRLDLANGSAAYRFGSVSGNPVDMRVGSDGSLYVLTRGSIVRFSSP
ncbi:MAG: PQQ-dependent sugar dehydrogenase [Piscinibacter sp.]|uniref:PQQ-dependent sugar dehydrogenase n=1 Tax=Piscinibacter sp. TaxID=1903157 RepID=UPI00258B1284|nr:PQQ-dependent sugar dehydrogenase [Piscinibacter sp.]MCW5665055.1 PQQ-dependent sugar dehydrogenase [Piscinibacter sp.]